MDEDLEDGDMAGKNDDELSLPKATMNKLIQEMLPSDIACARETRDVLLACCVEFIHLVSSEANDICEKGSKKTINAEHVLAALNTLGFESYVDEVKEALSSHKTEVKERSLKKQKRNTGLSDAELQAAQLKLLEEARQKVFNG